MFMKLTVNWYKENKEQTLAAEETQVLQCAGSAP